MRITILPHAFEQMQERGISAQMVRDVLERPDREYPGDFQRTVAEGRFVGQRSTIKVVYNRGLGDERIVVTVMRGRPRR